MEDDVRKHIGNLLSRMKSRDPKLYQEVSQKINERPLTERVAEARGMSARGFADAAEGEPDAGAPGAPQVAETIVRRLARPVLLVRDNQFVPEFATDSAVWRERFERTGAAINAAIPAVGRIEVAGLGIPFLGTGWLIDGDVLVTNRHVALEFAKRDTQRFVFRTSGGRLLSAQVDFLEEHERPGSLEFPLTEVLWIAGPSDSDIAFLRVARTVMGRALTGSIKRSRSMPAVDQFVTVIGYPARDPSFPDQALMERVFGDVFDKKRVAPGQLLKVSERELEHDCTTLGGNSGSVVLDLESGDAVGLHFAGRIFSANFAVAAATVWEKLDQLNRGELTRPADVAPPAAASDVSAAAAVPQVVATAAAGSTTATFTIPVDVTVRIGGMTQAASIPQPGSKPGFEAALAEAKTYLLHDSDVQEVRLGYRFQRGWITKERAIVVEVKEKLPNFALRDLGKTPYPRQFGGVGVDIRTAPLLDRLRGEGVAFPVVEEAVRHGHYVPPAHLRLKRFKEDVRAIFHVSPDSGFPNLRAFLARTDRRLVATMYESGAQHVRDALVGAVRDHNDHLRMVTDRKSGMRELVGDLEDTLGSRFDQHWASVGGGELLFPSAYHIKVTVRDRQETWLSSGNWKDSNQPDIHPAATNETSFGPLLNHNREWHAIIDNPNLASQFDGFIEYDFSEAERVPVEEAVPAPPPDLFVPVEPMLEARAVARYFRPLEVNRLLEIQPLLTPDNYLSHVTEVIRDARRSILFQNQSFNLLQSNEPAVEEVFKLLRDKQRTCEVKIILRDAGEFGRGARAGQDALLERLQDFGFDMDNVRRQKGCHTKGIVVDKKVVVLGSHNWTNEGMLFNRDASLIVFDPQVAAYFEEIFRFDWLNLAKQESEESPVFARVAAPGEPAPEGMRRVSLSEYLEMQG